MNAPTVYTNSNNATLGHKCFLTLQTIYTNWERGSQCGRPMNAPTGLWHLLNLFYINSVPLLACVPLTPLYFPFFNF